MDPDCVDIVVPWRPGCPVRQAAFDWLVPRWYDVAAQHGGGVRYGVGRPGGPWIKAVALASALRRVPGNRIVVVTDADVLCDGLDDAIAAVRDGAAWAIPHKLVCRLTEESTPHFMAGAGSIEYEERPYVGVEGGGIVVARRDALLDVPPDPRFVGWGQEDESWGIALRWLLGPPAWLHPHHIRTHNLYHLWHPPQERFSRNRGSHEGWELRKRYFDARYTDGAMRALIEEAKDALAVAHADVRHH